MTRVKPFGPRDFDKWSGGSLGPEFQTADEIHIITAVEPAAIGSLPTHWNVHNLTE